MDSLRIEIDQETLNAIKFLSANGTDIGPLVRHAIRRLAYITKERETVADEIARFESDPEYLKELREINLAFPPYVPEG